MTESVYLLGAPGVGKSTVLSAYLAEHGWMPLPETTRLQGRLVGNLLADRNGEVRAVYLGKHRPAFPGTDALSMAVAPDAREWARRIGEDSSWLRLVVGEGARLGNAGFLRALAETTHLTVALLTASPEVLTERRVFRGSDQAEQWMRGAETAARNAAESVRGHAARVLTISTDGCTPEEIASLL